MVAQSADGDATLSELALATSAALEVGIREGYEKLDEVLAGLT